MTYALLYGFLPMSLARRAHDNRRVPIYIVERRLTRLTPAHLAAVQRALAEIARRISSDDEIVRYLRCTFVPADGRCLCMFEASTEEIVRRVNELAQVPFDAIAEALHVEAPGRAPS